MLNISFAWTTPALIRGEKSCTRRDWPDHYARLFVTACTRGDLVAAYDRQPRFGGKRVALIELLSVTNELTSEAPAEDYVREGFVYLASIGMKVDGMTPQALWREWKSEPDRRMWVIRFKLVRLDVKPTAPLPAPVQREMMQRKLL